MADTMLLIAVTRCAVAQQQRRDIMTSSVNHPGCTHVPGLSFTWSTASVVSVYQFCSSLAVCINGLVHLAVDGTWWGVNVASERQMLLTYDGRMLADSWSPPFIQTIKCETGTVNVQAKCHLQRVRAKQAMTVQAWCSARILPTECHSKMGADSANLAQSMNQSMNQQSMNQTISQSVNQSTNQLINWPTNHPRINLHFLGQTTIGKTTYIQHSLFKAFDNRAPKELL